MGKAEIREPSQKRSIEKKQKIIKYGFSLICQKGFHNTNTAEIAKAAGVSTGIVYQYFKDKHDILINGIDQYAKYLMIPVDDISLKNIDRDHLYDTFECLVDLAVKKHQVASYAHEEISSFRHSDPEVAEIFKNYEEEQVHMLAEVLKENKFKKKNILERSHMIINIIEDYCHEAVYHNHEEFEYEEMKQLVVETIIFLLKK